MNNGFFEKPILNSPYEYPARHWELDDQGQPTGRIIKARRSAEFITPVPKPRKRKGLPNQRQLIFDEGKAKAIQPQKQANRTNSFRLFQFYQFINQNSFRGKSI